MNDNEHTSLQDHFLIATPALNGAFFHHSVICLYEHDNDGSMGLLSDTAGHA